MTTHEASGTTLTSQMPDHDALLGKHGTTSTLDMLSDCMPHSYCGQARRSRGSGVLHQVAQLLLALVLNRSDSVRTAKYSCDIMTSMQQCLQGAAPERVAVLAKLSELLLHDNGARFAEPLLRLC